MIIYQLRRELYDYDFNKTDILMLSESLLTCQQFAQEDYTIFGYDYTSIDTKGIVYSIFKYELNQPASEELYCYWMSSPSRYDNIISWIYYIKSDKEIYENIRSNERCLA